MSRLKDLYNEQIVDAMTKKFGYKNVMEVPKLSKIVINMGVGEAKENAKLLDAAISDMEAITGQKAVTTKAKNSVANFKIREGMPIGCKVTLRGEKMYEFVYFSSILVWCIDDYSLFGILLDCQIFICKKGHVINLDCRYIRCNIFFSNVCHEE